MSQGLVERQVVNGQDLVHCSGGRRGRGDLILDHLGLVLSNLGLPFPSPVPMLTTVKTRMFARGFP